MPFSDASSLPPAPPRRVHPTVRLGYLVRVSTYPFYFVLFGEHLWRQSTPIWIWTLFVWHLWLWPHAARRLAAQSADSKAAELRNLLVDAVFIGFLVPVSNYGLWPNAAAFLGIHTGMLSVGGPKASLRGFVGYVAGAAITGLLLRSPVDLLGASLFTQALSILVVIAYSSVFAWLTYARQRSVVQHTRMIREQTAEIAEHGRLLELRGRELEAALHAAEAGNAAKGNFLANMSHELRTPLNSIIGFSNILLRNPAGSLVPQDLTYLSRIRANGAHLLTLINGVLDLSKIDAQQVRLELTDVDVASAIREVLASLEPQAEERGIALVAELVPTEPLLADRTRLQQIVGNLASNAVKFTPSGSVTVRLVRDERTGRPARIDVTDTGIGIAAGRVDAIFDAFQQEDETTARQFGGTGLGLTISRSLAHVMGWEIAVRSELGTGSTFSVLIAREELAHQIRPSVVSGTE